MLSVLSCGRRAARGLAEAVFAAIQKWAGQRVRRAPAWVDPRYAQPMLPRFMGYKHDHYRAEGLARNARSGR